MEDSVWRIWARVVAYVELGMYTIESMFVLLRAFVVVSYTITGALVSADNEFVTDKAFDRFRGNNLWWTWARFVWFTLMTGIHLWASLQLLSATKLTERNVGETLEKGHNWINVTLVSFVMEAMDVLHARALSGILIALFIGYWSTGGAIHPTEVVYAFTFWRLIQLFIVCKYVIELDKWL